MNTATKEKLAASIFGVFALLFLVLGVRNIGSTLAGPERGSDKTDAGLSYEVQEQLSAKLDTDGDGITDLEEQSVYETSPYIADTDSDGIDDGEEIARGENPLCPVGKSCTRGNLGLSVTESQQAVNLGGVESSGAPQGNANVSVAEIRASLIQAGADKASIDQISDEELISLYTETANSEQFTEQQEVYNAFTSQDPDAIRAILKEQGVGEDILSQVTDEQLVDLFKTALEQGQ